VRIIDVPFFAELSAKSVWEEVRRQPDILRYLPDVDMVQKTISRQYLFNVSTAARQPATDRCFYCRS
jgi:hypothetical protein